MAIYTVHAPASAQTFADPERFMFVRDGFYFWAMVLGAVWMLWHRLWLAALGYVALLTVLMIALSLLGLGSAAQGAAGFLLALLLGFEAASLRRLNLARRGYSNLGLVVGDDVESAERRFFDTWVAGERRSSVAKPPSSTTDSGIVGLFPSATISP
jgi:hypothetical protein